MNSVMQFLKHGLYKQTTGKTPSLILSRKSIVEQGYSTNANTEINTDKQKRRIEIEMQLLREAGEFMVPDTVSDKHWPELIAMPSKFQRQKFYRYLKKIEITSTKTEKKKEETRIRMLEKVKAFENNPHITYGLRRNSMFSYIRPSSMNDYYNGNIASSLVFGQKIILDLGYHEQMNQHETKSCLKQIQELYGFNKIDKEPFDIYFCNLPMKSDFQRKLYTALPPLKDEHCLFTVTDKSYLDLFPKEKLVYLTPDCRNDLKTFNYDDVYIVGAYVDKGPSKPLSMAKAKQEGIRMARFPLERYLHWGVGNKSLTLDQVVKILLTAKNCRSWTKAFEHIPKRKLHRIDYDA